MDREKLATYAHNAWSGWMKYMFEKSIRNSDGTVTIPAWAVERWERQAQTPYARLPKAEKESDLAEADCMLRIVTMDRKQEKEVMEYLKRELDIPYRNSLLVFYKPCVRKIVKTIMRRYDFVPRGE